MNHILLGFEVLFITPRFLEVTGKRIRLKQTTRCDVSVLNGASPHEDMRGPEV
jgi:hypothetical protein